MTLLSTSAGAQNVLIGHPNWDLYQTSGGAGCFAQPEYESGGTVGVGYNRREDYSSLVATSPSWQLVPDQDVAVLIVTSDNKRWEMDRFAWGEDSLMINLHHTEMLDIMQHTDWIILAWDNTIMAQVEFVNLADGIQAVRDTCGR